METALIPITYIVINILFRIEQPWNVTPFGNIYYLCKV